MIDHTHDPAAVCWVESAAGHADFPVQNLPLGIFSLAGGSAPRGGTAIGDAVLDLVAIAPLLEADVAAAVKTTAGGTLNALAAAGPDVLRRLRHGLFALLTDPAQRPKVANHLHDAAGCTLHLPFAIGDYTDFYTGIHHAENIGRIFRPDNPLLPNYKYVPIGYHGRASSVRVSGGEVRRPMGQTRPAGHEAPGFGPSRRLDYELEMAIWVGQGNELGQPVPIGEAGAHIAGLSLLNDWSARDVQAWEYQPLGPFLAKNFHTGVSPWVVTLDALAPFRRAQPPRPAGDPAPLPYLYDEADQASGAFDITMEVLLTTRAMREAGLSPHRLSIGSTLAMYWTPAQLVAHHASNGCNLAPGDLLGTGTLSGADPSSFGSLMEITASGTQPIALPTGETRTFLEDGDEVVMTAWAEAEGRVRVGFGSCAGVIAP
ncbi:fumarylacetoacetase [Sphingomonas sp. BGYR3]|uniref:fumarylacetoacetase n=1 Tax=Sphingomonas sp. BGYR3 TaxID=2975483 RepID=UPI0021A5E8A9|nr:fumarylacetoacetase [Sphingomonas sp. BGYR3]MDG5487764.1 fumarylacetoacetase [Sphingomonas sp. BGYR3]